MLLPRVLTFLGALATVVSATPPGGDTISRGATHHRKRGNGTSLVTYPIPSSVATRNTFSIKARPVHGGDWQSVSAFEISLAEVNLTTGSSMQHRSSVATFDFDRSVEVSITYNSGIIRNARVRPDSYSIVPQISGNTISFMLTQPRNIMIQVNDDIFDCLHLFTNPTAVHNGPAPTNSSNVLYYGPGLHTVPGNAINVTSGQTVYVAGGAVLKANINFINVTSASLKGRGVLLNPGGGVLIEHSSNILVEDVILLNPSASIQPAMSEKITIRGIRSLSNRQWGDGIDVFCSSHVLVDNVFMRNSDDCIAVYNHRWDYYGDNHNITIQNSSLWADLAHPINIGTHGNTVNPELTDKLTIRNIDILDHREVQVAYQGCIALNPGDENLLTNVLIEDVRVEDFRAGQLINMRVMFNEKYNTGAGRGIRNATVRNLSYNGTHAQMSIVAGYDDARQIEFVHFDNLTINGKIISDTMSKPGWYSTSDFVPMYVNDHVQNLTFSG